MLLFKLQEDVLDKVLSLLPIADQIRFAAVCHRCRKIQSRRRLQYAPRPPPAAPSLPWIIFWKDYNGNKRLYYSPAEHRLYTLWSQLSVDQRSARCISSCHGWILLRHGNYGCQLTLWNPVSGAEIQLPTIGSSFSDNHFLISMSGAPTNLVDDDDCFILMIIAKLSHIFLLRVGDPQWAELDLKLHNNYLIGAVFCKGKFYCMCGRNRNLLAIDPISALSVGDNNLNPSSIQLLEMDINTGSYRPTYLTVFIIESDGEILLAFKVFDKNTSGARFLVFRADLKRNTWVRIESLGDRSLWLGCCRVSIQSSDAGRRDNLFDVPPGYVFEWKGCDRCHVFNLKTGWMMDSSVLANVSSSLEVSYHFGFGTIIWFVPTLRY